MDVSYQRRLAAEVLGVGYHRVWIDPNRLKEVAAATTKEDIRKLIKMGVIGAKPVKGTSRHRARARRDKRRGPGSRKGGKYAIVNKKRRWINTIRPIRAELKELRDKGKIDRHTYRRLVKMAKAGMIRSVSYLYMYLKKEGIIKEEQQEENHG
ncbi:MAG: 50S ribosomal protein L19e [bacterium]|nr:50S ribosomal protein L19e [bacterium]